jgi:hypothetical protein
LSINNELVLPYGQTPAAGPDPMVATGAGTISGVQIYQFRGGAASWFGTQILGVLITICTIGICYPFAVVLVERWRAKNTYLHGRQLQFIGTDIAYVEVACEKVKYPTLARYFTRND